MSNFLKSFFCKIVTFNEADNKYFIAKYENTGILIIDGSTEHITFDQPTQIVGEINVIQFEKTGSKDNKRINSNLFWTVSPDVDEKQCNIDTQLFLNFASYNFSPYSQYIYDEILNGDFHFFINSIYSKSDSLYLYFKDKALYIYSKKILSCISLETMKYSGTDVKLAMFKLLSTYSCVVFSYENFIQYLPLKFEGPVVTFENVYWSRYYRKIEEHDFVVYFNGNLPYKNIPYLFGIYLEDNPITEEEKIAALRFYSKDKITAWLSNMYLTLDKSIDKADKISKNLYYLRLQYSNKRTITGRINCIDKRFNPQMLPKASPIRLNVVSSFKGGKIAVFDFISFETKIALYACGDKTFIDKYKDKDLHAETAAIIFNEATYTLTSTQRSIGKSINHALLYGGGNETLLDILKNESVDKDDALIRVKEFLSPIINKSNEIRDLCKEFGYVINPFGIIIRPQKIWAAFNNFIQSTAADIVVNKLYEIQFYLQNKKSTFLYQVHDSFIFDIHPDELDILPILSALLSKNFAINFSIEYKTGNNLAECTVNQSDFKDVFTEDEV